MIIFGNLPPKIDLEKAKAAGYQPVNLASVERSVSQLQANLSKTRRPKNSGAGSRQPEACRGTAADRDPQKFTGLLHLVGHALTGRCISLEMRYENFGALGRFILTNDGKARILLAGNLDTTAQIKTYLHELGHCRAHDWAGNVSEAAADLWRDTWLDYASENAWRVVDFSGALPGWAVTLKTLLTYPGD